MKAVILSGGSGQRLWPVSRTQFPKQFCQLFDKPLHQLTLERLSDLGRPLIVGSQDHKDMMQKFSGGSADFLLEPVGRNTAPAIALACQWMKLQGQENEVLGVFPSDHLIQDKNKFLKAIHLAEAEARKLKLIVFGIAPTRPATGYGYIEVADSQASLSSVQQFKEKPDMATAVEYLQSGNYFWNSGIFVFSVSHMIQLLQKHLPEVWSLIQDLKSDLSNLDAIYSALPSVSIDYGIIEKLNHDEISCVKADFNWSDVGSWDAVSEIKDPKASNFVYSEDDRLVVTSGVENLIVVDTKDALLITEKGKSENIKAKVAALENSKARELDEHILSHRPWGTYEILKDSQQFKSKLITVQPGQRLSYQSHENREEHWIIVSGSGVVTLDGEEHPVKEGSSIKIPKQAKHRMSNNSDSVLQFVEVQLGTYFGEDDITRYEDDYSRS